MKVLALNGSPKPHGNTGTALKTVFEELARENIETEMITLGGKNVRGCIGCMQCAEKQTGRCIAFDDIVNETMPKLLEADAILVGSPVYFAGINGTLKSFMDRAFFVAVVNGGAFRLKPAAGVVALRRSGGTAAFEQLNKYFQISEMLTVGSSYWNIVHGLEPGEVNGDAEGLNVMRVLGRNLAWTLKLIENGKDNVAKPAQGEAVRTNFVR